MLSSCDGDAKSTSPKIFKITFNVHAARASSGFWLAASVVVGRCEQNIRSTSFFFYLLIVAILSVLGRSDAVQNVYSRACARINKHQLNGSLSAALAKCFGEKNVRNK